MLCGTEHEALVALMCPIRNGQKSYYSAVPRRMLSLQQIWRSLGGSLSCSLFCECLLSHPHETTGGARIVDLHYKLSSSYSARRLTIHIQFSQLHQVTTAFVFPFTRAVIKHLNFVAVHFLPMPRFSKRCTQLLDNYLFSFRARNNLQKTEL
jgi:hypothetical protein